jgi:hypothetical protein
VNVLPPSRLVSRTPAVPTMTTVSGGDDRAALVQRGLKALADLLAGVGISFSSPGIGHEWD